MAPYTRLQLHDAIMDCALVSGRSNLVKLEDKLLQPASHFLSEYTTASVYTWNDRITALLTLDELAFNEVLRPPNPIGHLCFHDTIIGHMRLMVWTR
jgi:hypothetical protein